MKYIILVFLITINVFAVDATMEIVKTVGFKPKIMVIDNSNESFKQISQKVYNQIVNDLEVSGHFNVDIKKDIGENFVQTYLKSQGYNLLLMFQIDSITQAKGVSVSAELIDLNTNITTFKKTYAVPSVNKYPFISHSVAIEVNSYIKAPSIDWMNKFVVFAKYTDVRASEIVIADYTLSFQQTIIKGGLNIFPKWASTEQREIYYTSLNGQKPTLYKVNIFSAQKEKIYESNGMIVCSDVSEDGNKLLVTMAPHDHPDIYIIDMNSKELIRVTDYKGIDVNGHFVENEQRVVFVSDRLSSPNIFIKNVNGGGAEKLVDYGVNNSSCSTYNNYIVFASKETKNEFSNKSFNLYLVSSTSDYVRKLTTNGVNQFPSFSEDGETILYLRQEGALSSLGILRLNQNKSFLYPIKINRIQSIDW